MTLWMRMLAWTIALSVVARAGVSYEVLHAFKKPPVQIIAPLVLHADGSFYGVGSAGGTYDLGAVFRVNAAGVVTVLHSFDGTDGSGPAAKLVQGADLALYGTAAAGGANGFGTVFKITTAGVFTKLVDFTGAAGAAPGSVPHGLVLNEADGNFYGVAQAGGSLGAGTVFKMTPAGVVTTLVNFSGTAGTRPGSEPVGPLAVSGTLLYGVTTLGGAGNLGTIFEVSTTGSWRSLGAFTGTAGARAGANPAGGLMLNPDDGLLYGTAEFGGSGGFGTAFKITTAASPVFTVLRNFLDPSGSQPAGALVRGSDGHLYGAATNGGVDGFGAVFRLTTAGVYTVLANFSGEAGAAPGAAMRGGLMRAVGGVFYGITSSGGPGNLGAVFSVTTGGVFSSVAPLSPVGGWMPSGAPVAAGADLLFPVASGGANGGGNLSQVSTGGAVSVVAALGGTLGSLPDGGLLAAGADFYGVAAKGAASARGSMFRYSPGSGAALVSSFVTSGGSLAEGPVVVGADGAFYGVSREGGASTRGTIYKVSPAGVRTRLVSFTGTAGAAPGAIPQGPMVLAADGNFYGLTEQGGAANTGVIFRLTAAGLYSVVASFGATGPRLPQGGFVTGADGLLYATTSAGGTGDFGTVIRFTPETGAWLAVAEFTGAAGLSPGEMPAGELMVGPDGALYGTTLFGGADDEGVVFRYTAAAGLRALVQFSGPTGASPGSAGGTDGAGLVITGGLAFGQDGLLYGVAPSGGFDGGGVVYRISTALQTWKTAELGDANAADLDDADQDGLPNVLEYALLTDPALADVAAVPAAGITSFPDGDRMAITVPRDPERDDVTVIVEVSETLMADSWTVLATSVAGGAFSGPGYHSGDASSPGLKSVVIRDIQLSSAATRRFLRIRVVH